MDKPISRFTARGQILPNMPDIPQVIKSTTASLSEQVVYTEGLEGRFSRV